MEERISMEIAFGVIGGLGLFLYGINVMSSGLQKVAGDKLRSIIGLLTTNKYVAVLVGAVVTAIIQSSSASTVMVVGFLNAGIMQIEQAVGVIMGANIGTTITAHIIAFNINKYAPLIIGISVGVWIFTKKQKIKQIAEAFIGFGILFIGMSFMADALKPLQEYEEFRNILLSFGKTPLLGVLAGFVITVIVQSSSASTGILLALAMEELITIESGLPILFGINMGTTTTTLLSSIGANLSAKRAALFHFLFNFIGTIIFITLFRTLTLKVISYLIPINVAKQVALAHTIFNLITTIILLPFSNLLIKVANRTIPGMEEEFFGIKYIDNRILETPSIAVVSAIKETLHMGNIAKESVQNALEGYMENDSKKIEDSYKLEGVIDEIEREMAEYLVKLSSTNISSENRRITNELFSTINDIERVGDHAENIAELAQQKIDNKISFTGEALGEIKEMGDLTLEAYTKALDAMATLNMDTAREVLDIENKVDAMEKEFRYNHIDRLNCKECMAESAVIFLDAISNLERITDHSANIALMVLDREK